MRSDLIRRQDAIDVVSGIDREFVRYIEALQSAKPEQHGRVFKGIVVEYPSYNTYPEYKGKPYFSIKYTENGQEFIGYGTYKPEVLSEYLKEYFMPSAESERMTGKWQEHKDYPGLAYLCSECGYFTTMRTDFCPMCGADMRGERRNK